MRWIVFPLILLVALEVAFAQALFFLVDVPEYQIEDAYVSKASGDTVSVIIQCFDDQIRQFYYALTNAEIVSPIFNIGTWEGQNPTVLSAQLLEDGRWVCIFTTSEVIGVDSLLHYGWLTIGDLSGSQTTEMIHRSIERQGTFDSGGPLVEARIEPMFEAGYVATTSSRGRWGVEPVSGIATYSDLEGVGLFTGDHECMAFPYCWSEDSVDVLVYRNLGGNVFARYVVDCDTCIENEILIISDWMCHGLILMTTASGRRLMAWGSVLYEVSPDGSCVEIGTFDGPENYYPNTRYSSCAPNNGFYFLDYTYPEQLIRVDTTGVLYNAGRVHYNGGGHRLMLNRLGEAIVTSHTGTRVYCTIVPWDVLLGAENNVHELPVKYSLSTYPNPFNSTVRIDYELPRAGDVSLSVFNTLGQRVATLIDGRAQAGVHTQNWSPSTASGVYLIRLESGELVTSTKVLYIQ